MYPILARELVVNEVVGSYFIFIRRFDVSVVKIL